MFFLGEEDNETFVSADEDTTEAVDGEDLDSGPETPKVSDEASSPRASAPISIPQRPRTRNPVRLQHADHTPPRGYMTSGLVGRTRFSTGSFSCPTSGGSSSAPATVTRTISTQTSVSLTVEHLIQQSIDVQEQALRLQEQQLVENRK